MSAAKTNRTSVMIHNTLGLVVHVYYNIYASSMQRVNLRKLACVSSLGPLSRWHVLFWPTVWARHVTVPMVSLSLGPSLP